MVFWLRLSPLTHALSKKAWLHTHFLMFDVDSVRYMNIYILGPLP